jgi:hypothetical protein
MLFMPYLIFGRMALTRFKEWLTTMLDWGDSFSGLENFPNNYSFSRILGIFEVDLIGYLPLVAFVLIISIITLREKIEISPQLISTFVLILTFTGTMVNTYYLVFLVPTLIFTLAYQKDNDSVAGLELLNKHFLTACYAFAVTPIAIPSRWKVNDVVGPNDVFNLFPVIAVLLVFLFTCLHCFALVRGLLKNSQPFS